MKDDMKSVDLARPKSRLWLWSIAAFVLQILGWTTWIVIASHHRVAEVPLLTSR
jgi:hypothetical protein